jgi:DNA-binding SARP family transcriptional activator
VATAEVSTVHVSVLGHFCLRRSGQPIGLSVCAARLVALLTISRQPLARSRAAGLLWPGSSPTAARTDLRSAIHQVRRGCARILDLSDEALTLHPDLGVDLYEAERLSVALSTGTWSGDPAHALRLLRDDVLQDWTDEWLGEAQWQHRLHRSLALGWLSEALSREGRHGAAVDAAMLAVEADPLQDSARLALVRAHASGGNLSQALAEVDRFRELLNRELGEGVPACLLQEVASLVSRRQRRQGQTSHQASLWGLPSAAPGLAWPATGVRPTAPMARR